MSGGEDGRVVTITARSVGLGETLRVARLDLDARGGDCFGPDGRGGQRGYPPRGRPGQSGGRSGLRRREQSQHLLPDWPVAQAEDGERLPQPRAAAPARRAGLGGTEQPEQQVLGA